MTKYIAFLRGINVGGKTIKMKDLTEVFQRLGFKNIKTVLASGNVIFESDATDLINKIQLAIKYKFGFEVLVQVRSFEEIEQIVKVNPFASFKPDKNIHWYVTFLNGVAKNLPTVADPRFKIISISHNALFSIFYRDKAKSTDFMSWLDKNFGKGVTTRNWNTLLKIVRN